jgi:hypothetical protein
MTPSALRRGAWSAGLLLSAGLLAGCNASQQAQQQVADLDETLVRTAVSTQATQALMGVNVEISGPMACTSVQAGGGAVTVNCTATSLTGQPVTLTGSVTALIGGTSPKGTFTATAAGQQVLNTDCLGSC